MARQYRIDEDENTITGEELLEKALDIFDKHRISFKGVAIPNTVAKAVWFYTHILKKTIYSKLSTESIWKKI